MTPREKMLQSLKAIQLLCDAVIESAQIAGPLGVPEGTLYAAFMAYGLSLPSFEQILSILQSAGRIRRAGFVVYHVERAQ